MTTEQPTTPAVVLSTAQLNPLPCPFCGNIGVNVHEASSFRWLVAECNNCGAQCGEVRRDTRKLSTEAENKEIAITEWNVRFNAESNGAEHPCRALSCTSPFQTLKGNIVGRDQEKDLKALADAFFAELTMIELEYGGIGLDPKRPFGNSDVERDILELLDCSPDGDDGESECFSSAQREYARSLYQEKLIPYLRKRWAEL